MNYTSIEQSKKLLELGLSPESADMFYCFGMDTYTGVWDFDDEPTVKGEFTIDICDIPCWSVGVLFKMLPEEFTTKNDIGEYTYRFRMSDKRTIEYGCYINKFIDFWKPMISYANDDFLDVCYNMMVWLLENGYIKKGE